METQGSVCVHVCGHNIRAYRDYRNLKRLLKGPKMWSLKTGDLLTQVNYSGKCSFDYLWGQFFLTQVVLRTGSTIYYYRLYAIIYFMHVVILYYYILLYILYIKFSCHLITSLILAMCFFYIPLWLLFVQNKSTFLQLCHVTVTVGLFIVSSAFFAKAGCVTLIYEGGYDVTTHTYILLVNLLPSISYGVNFISVIFEVNFTWFKVTSNKQKCKDYILLYTQRLEKLVYLHFFTTSGENYHEVVCKQM